MTNTDNTEAPPPYTNEKGFTPPEEKPKDDHENCDHKNCDHEGYKKKRNFIKRLFHFHIHRGAPDHPWEWTGLKFDLRSQDVFGAQQFIESIGMVAKIDYMEARVESRKWVYDGTWLYNASTKEVMRELERAGIQKIPLEMIESKRQVVWRFQEVQDQYSTPHADHEKLRIRWVKLEMPCCGKVHKCCGKNGEKQ